MLYSSSNMVCPLRFSIFSSCIFCCMHVFAKKLGELDEDLETKMVVFRACVMLNACVLLRAPRACISSFCEMGCRYKEISLYGGRYKKIFLYRPHIRKFGLFFLISTLHIRICSYIDPHKRTFSYIDPPYKDFSYIDPHIRTFSYMRGRYKKILLYGPLI